MKNLIICLSVFLLGFPLYSADLQKNRPISNSICKLAIENIELLRMSEQPEPWFRNSTTAISLNLTRLIVDRFPSVGPSLNQKYYELKDEFLTNIYSYSKVKMKDDLSYYVIAQIPPATEEGLIDYISKLVDVSIQTFHSDQGDKEVATLTSVNQLLNTISSNSGNAMILLLGELEVWHPSQYVELKNSSEVHALYLLKGELERTILETSRLRNLPGPPSPRLEGATHQREDLREKYEKQRAALFRRLIKEGKRDEVFAIEAMFDSYK